MWEIKILNNKTLKEIIYLIYLETIGSFPCKDENMSQL